MPSSGSTADPRRTLRQLIKSAWIVQAIHAAAALGVADRLASGARATGEIAVETAADATAMRRLLRALATLGLVRALPGDRWELTALGEPLGTDTPGSLHAYALLHGRQLWSRWGRMPEAVRTGAAAKGAGAATSFDAFQSDDESSDVFGAAMAGVTGGAATSLVEALALADTGTLMDVGGGQGQLLAAALVAHPALRGVLVDLPYALEPARARLRAAGVERRCTLHGADFFEPLPAGSDAAVLKSVLHDWSDARCAALLDGCRRALPAGGRLLVIERLLPDQIAATADDREIVASDLTMLVATEGRERTLAELSALLACSGFALEDVTAVGGYTVVAARAVAC